MRNILFIVVLICCCSIYSCKTTSSNPYEDMKEKMFDSLINELGANPTHLDTIYAEMYIALKVIKEYPPAEDTVLVKGNYLVENDDDIENKIHYLEAISIVYSARKDYDNFWKTNFKIYNLYPKESLERNSSFAMFYKMRENTDSALFYINKTIDIANKDVLSKDKETRYKAYMIKATMLIINSKDDEALSYLKSCLLKEKDNENRELIEATINNFEEFKEMTLSSVNNEKMKSSSINF